ncbi:MAG: lysophospholipid acyltransferase family protein [Sneathiella sp.]|nr:lysophospholipid acyltransferase family protein [Sneathiella sp.]
MRSVEFLTGQPKLNRIYQRYRAEQGREARNFWDAAIDRLKLNLTYDPVRLSNIPKEGPLVVVANHPYGVIDGLTACYLISRVRPDFKFLAHSAFLKAPELNDYLIPIHFEGSSSSLRANVEPRRQAISHLSNGGVIIIFPAGRVSTSPKVFDEAVDAPWKLFAASMIQRSQADVLPLHFEGKNSWLFHFVSLFSESLREAVLLGETRKRINSTLTANIGEIIAFEKLATITDRQEMLDIIRSKVFELQQR